MTEHDGSSHRRMAAASLMCLLAVTGAFVVALVGIGDARAATLPVVGITIPLPTLPTAPTLPTPPATGSPGTGSGTSTTTTTTTTTAPAPPQQDPFYSYSGATPLQQIPPGTVLKTRTVSYHVAGISTAITAVQLLYRSTTVSGQPTTNVTSVLLPPTPSVTPRLIGYGSFYDSLSVDDEPSYVYAGAPYSSSRQLVAEETAAIAPLLLDGYTVSVADTEGQQAQFAAGPEYGRLTLDALRAASSSPDTGLTQTTPIALMGYSGGAIATGWAAQQARTYAPDVERRLVGATMGGVLIEPAHNLTYVSGSKDWAGVMPMALIGVARAYGVSFAKYLSPYGAGVIAGMQQDGIDEATGDYPYLTFAQLVKPRYANPDSIRPFVQVANQLILGHDALPKVPLLISQGAGGEGDGSSSTKPGIGPGDGVMIAGDVRSYALEACKAGDAVDYTEYDSLTHEQTLAPWLASTIPWLATRFAGTPAPSDCGSIAPGNPLTPIEYQPPGN